MSQIGPSKLLEYKASYEGDGVLIEHRHLTAEALGRMLSLDRTEDQNWNLLHQISLCLECRKVGGYLLDLHEAGLLSPVFSSIDLSLARSRFDAPRLWQRLSSFTPVQRSGLVRASRSFASWGLSELLCRESLKRATQDPTEAIELGELALFIADSIKDGEPAEEHWLYQLRAYAWAHLANSRRVAGDLPGAEEALTSSVEWWNAGEIAVGDALGYGPHLLDLEASLRVSQRRFMEAIHLVERACQGYLQGGSPLGPSHPTCRTLIKKALALIQMGSPEQALRCLREAEPLLTLDGDPRLNLCLKHNLISALIQIGRLPEALALFPEVRALSEELGNALDLIRLRWIEAKTNAALGRKEVARRGLSKVHLDFVDRRMTYDARLVSKEIEALV